ncbi:MAG: hypothetical protein UW68_C0001G0016 [Candidatus Collierbacteria bacterium GW2011_GWB1_44_6]|uniref:Uncharacterized protein n=2 Tax=Candidatus Collieribacteriota TaxID=1752725 RepID=A0A0G1JQV7_9BACT|nr:MAG: hypothetical protein UV68_C0006G0014 [Candidatus Collierbacteria bacterium GW2011_GWC2_43_12]KKT73820.1 MAG: hypothetical protein UW68_C0001G0016 [Candidatus Collierbacteria bacterium GW2011_GWB1_44_6]KKT84061.1 MAG: hypothetical protein UW80_C0002G0014 [Microgenomates group bacterium GW2011_GWC1_44_9]
MNNISQKGQSLATYSAILLLVAIVVVLGLYVYVDIVERSNFKKAIDSGSITIIAEGASLHGGVVTHPSSVDPFDVPSVDASGIISYPRAWTLSGCISVAVPNDKGTLYAAVPLPQEMADKIQIQTPITGGEMVNICGPEWLPTEIYLWVEE